MVAHKQCFGVSDHPALRFSNEPLIRSGTPPHEEGNISHLNILQILRNRYDKLGTAFIAAVQMNVAAMREKYVTRDR